MKNNESFYLGCSCWNIYIKKKFIFFYDIIEIIKYKIIVKIDSFI